MTYQGFWGLLALTLVLLAHCAYLWFTETRGKELASPPKKVKVCLGAMLLLCVAVFVAGVVLILCQADEAVVHVAGLGMLLLGFCFNSQMRRFISYFIKEEQEELTNE